MVLSEPTDRISFSFTEDEDDEVIMCHAAPEEPAEPIEDLAGLSPRIAPPRPGRYVPKPFNAMTKLWSV
jgi:hypothetical protein